MSGGLVIRDVAPADIAAVRAVLAATWEATYSPLVGREKVAELVATWHAPAALAAQVDQTGAAFLLAERDGAVVGTAFAMRHGQGAVCLRRLYVLPAEQGRGIGRHLLDATLARFPGATGVWLEVEPRNAGAIAFYRHCGFAPEEAQESCGGRADMRSLVMRRAGAVG